LRQGGFRETGKKSRDVAVIIASRFVKNSPHRPRIME
jgi:hypothetical protein